MGCLLHQNELTEAFDQREAEQCREIGRGHEKVLKNTVIHFSSCKKSGRRTRSARKGWLLHTPALRAGKQRAEDEVQGGGTASRLVPPLVPHVFALT